MSRLASHNYLESSKFQGLSEVPGLLYAFVCISPSWGSGVDMWAVTWVGCGIGSSLGKG